VPPTAGLPLKRNTTFFTQSLRLRFSKEQSARKRLLHSTFQELMTEALLWMLLLQGNILLLLLVGQNPRKTTSTHLRFCNAAKEGLPYLRLPKQPLEGCHQWAL
jgi:hypothetical protein